MIDVGTTIPPLVIAAVPAEPMKTMAIPTRSTGMSPPFGHSASASV